MTSQKLDSKCRQGVENAFMKAFSSLHFNFAFIDRQTNMKAKLKVSDEKAFIVSDFAFMSAVGCWSAFIKGIFIMPDWRQNIGNDKKRKT